MKQFNLEEYLRLKEEGKEPKIVTRVGMPVRILCTDLKSDNFPIAAAVDYGEREGVFTCTKNGCFKKSRTTHNFDIFFAPVKHEGWVNIYRGVYDTRHLGGNLFDTEKEAMDTASIGDSHNHIATIKVEWTE